MLIFAWPRDPQGGQWYIHIEAIALISDAKQKAETLFRRAACWAGQRHGAAFFLLLLLLLSLRLLLLLLFHLTEDSLPGITRRMSL